MGVYYVRKDGNDTTGDGSTGNPWLTISKALASVSLAGGHTINVGAGTYNENTSSLNYCYVTQAFLDWVTIQPEVSGGSVIITGNGSVVYTLRFNGAKYIKFLNVSIVDDVAKDQATIYFGDVALGSYIAFENCVITGTKSADDRWLVRANMTGTNALNHISFTGCALSQANAAKTVGFSLIRAVATPTLDDISITNCSVDTQGSACQILGCTNLKIQGGSYICHQAIYGILTGLDSASGGIETTGYIRSAYVKSFLSHSLLVGNGAANFEVSGCNVEGGDHGIVVKENSNTSVLNNAIRGGSVAALRFKAAVGCVAKGNVISNNVAVCVKAGVGDTGNKCGTIEFTENKVIGEGSAAIFSWGGDTEDSGGCVVDKNSYRPNGSAAFGAVRSDSSVLNLTELRAAWAGYGDGSNDSHSRLFVPQLFIRRNGRILIV